MFIGTHVVIYSSNPDADRLFLRDVVKLGAVDAGGGYLILALPPAEASVHESQASGVRHELYLMCDDVKGFVASMKQHQAFCDPIQDTGWGLLTQLKLPSGGVLGVYQPKHERPAHSST
jgi:hypothetical protein